MVFISATYFFVPSVLDPVLWKEPSPLRKLDGNLQANSILDDSNFFEEILAPESIAFDEGGVGYASCSDGRVVALSEKGIFMRTVFFSGDFVGEQKERFPSPSERLLFCRAESLAHRLAWSPINERACGRPLGIRVIKTLSEIGTKSEMLVVVDAYHGVFKVDISTGVVQHLVSSETPIHLPLYADPAAGSPMKFFNDLDILPDGTIIFTDSSFKNSRAENRRELLDGAPRGRLMRFDPTRRHLSPLLCGLHFPNGVQILQRGDGDGYDVLVVEAARFRVLRVAIPLFPPQAGAVGGEVGGALLSSCGEDGSLAQALKQSSGAGAVSVFFDSAPGFLDNIRLDTFDSSVCTAVPTLDKNGCGSAPDADKGEPLAPSSPSPSASLPCEPSSNLLYVGVGSKSTQPFSLLWFGYQSIVLRQILGKFVSMKLVEHLVPKYGLVIVLDTCGKLVRSLHSPAGVVSFVSEAHHHPQTGDLWMGSHSMPLAILPAHSHQQLAA